MGVQLEFVGKGRWRVVEGFRVGVTVVPAGFTCDLASIPRALWSVMGHPLVGWYVAEAVAHDRDCAVRQFNSRVVHRLFYARLRLSANDATGWRRHQRLAHARLMYWAVALFGPRFRALS